MSFNPTYFNRMYFSTGNLLDDPAGKLEIVKNRLNDFVYVAVGGTVSNNWAVGVQQIGTFPLSTLRFGSLVLMDENYGGKVPEDGCWATYEFSIFIHERQVTTYVDTTPKFYLAMDDADDILDTLISRSEVEAEKNSTGIIKIFDLALDGVQPDKRARNVGRIIVTGRILAKWLDP